MNTSKIIKKKGIKHRHLEPIEILAITDAFERGEKVKDLALQYNVCRQTIYNSIKAIHEGNVKKEKSNGFIPKKRHRAKRITDEVRKNVVEMKLTYPAWGAAYLRTHWVKEGNRPLSCSSIYKILKEAGLETKQEVSKEKYRRFEMKRPGQLYQIDIQGKIYLKGIGWVYGHALIDDYSRFVPSFRYYSDEIMSNSILTLNDAIERYGIPEAIYVDNGSQFVSRGERMNNFQLYCAAYSIKIITSTPYRPQGKGKIERLFETIENQFITWVYAEIESDPNYSLTQLNKDLQDYLQTRYHTRIHGSIKEQPIKRFSSGRLRSPDPPVDVIKYLERNYKRTVNKLNEISYNGYKIQVDLPARARPTVVETIETIRVEYGGRLIREVNKNSLSKEVYIKRQDGVTDNNEQSKSKSGLGGLEGLESKDEKNDEKTLKKPNKSRKKNSHKPDQEGYYHRKVSAAGTIKINGVVHYYGAEYAGEYVLIRILGNLLKVYDENKHQIGTIEVHKGKRY